MPLSQPPAAATTPAFIGAKAYSDSTQSITGSGTTAVTLNQEEFDTNSFHDSASNTSRMTIPTGKSGTYLLQGGTFHDAQIFWIGFRKNGSTALRGYSAANAGSGYHANAIIVQLVAGDYVEMVVSASSANIGHASLPDAQSWFAVTLLGT